MPWMRHKKPHITPNYCFWKSPEKLAKIVHFDIFLNKKVVIFGSFSYFFQKRYFEERWGFMCCVCCISTLLLSYLNQQSKKNLIFFTLKITKNPKQKYFWEQKYKWIQNPDGTAHLKGWIKIRITLLQGCLFLVKPATFPNHLILDPDFSKPPILTIQSVQNTIITSNSNPNPPCDIYIQVHTCLVHIRQKLQGTAHT